jgi:hypothetical protein
MFSRVTPGNGLTAALGSDVSDVAVAAESGVRSPRVEMPAAVGGRQPGQVATPRGTGGRRNLRQARVASSDGSSSHFGMGKRPPLRGRGCFWVLGSAFSDDSGRHHRHGRGGAFTSFRVAASSIFPRKAAVSGARLPVCQIVNSGFVLRQWVNPASAMSVNVNRCSEAARSQRPSISAVPDGRSQPH